MLENEEQLEDLLARPSDADQGLMRRLAGDVIVVGAAGKMGPSLVRRLRRAADASSLKRRVIAVSRFSSPRPAVTWSGTVLKLSPATCWIRIRSRSCLPAKTFSFLRDESLARRTDRT